MKSEIELIVSDVDGTAVKYNNKPFYSSWDALADVLSKEQKKEWFSTRDEYLLKGNGFYREWFFKQVSSLRGVPVSDVEQILFPIPYTKGFREFFETLIGVKTALLSAGVDIVAKKIVDDVGFNYLVVQNIGVENGFFNGKGIPFRDGLDKSGELLKLCEVARVSLDKVCYVGDTFSDISCLDLVGCPVAFEPKGELIDYVREKNIHSIKDFLELTKF